MPNHFSDLTLSDLKLTKDEREILEGRSVIVKKLKPLPVEAIVRGYTWTVVPITWRNRRTGVAKLKIKEMGSRYFFIIMYVWMEKYFSRGDYRKKGN